MLKTRLKWIFCFASPLILLAPFSGIFDITTYFQRIALNPQKTGITTLKFHDEIRNRPLVTEVWYPVDPHIPAETASGVWQRCNEARDAPLSNKRLKYPLIILSHGSSGERFTISWLAEVLTANGYIVAAMDHYGNTWNNKIPECYARPWERPKDISFVLDQLLDHPTFKTRINEKKIGFAGYSLGGATGIWVAGAYSKEEDIPKMKQMCEKELTGVVSQEVMEKVDFKEACHSFLDKRFSAMFVMAPALGSLFSEESLKQIQIPIYIIAPEKDEIVPIEHNAKILANKIETASLFVLQGNANHFVFLNSPSLMGKRFLDAKYWGDPEGIDRRTLHEDFSKKAVKFFSENLK